MSKPEAGQLLQSTQRLRIHWSALIYALIGYTWAIFLGIWSVLLKAYMDASRPPTGPLDPVDYILIASAASSLVLGIWRLSTRRIDIRVARLLPTFIYCETIMEVPPDYGTLAYIKDHVLEDFKKDIPTDQTKLSRGIEHLVKMKRIGTRGQGSIDLFTALLIAAQLFFSLYQFHKSCSLAASVAIIVILFSLALVMMGCLSCQRNPKQKHVDEAFRQSSPLPELEATS